MPNDEGYTYTTETPEELTGRGQFGTLGWLFAVLGIIALVGSALHRILG